MRLIPVSGTHVHNFSDPVRFICRCAKQAVGAIVKGKRNERLDSRRRTCRIPSLRRLIGQYDRANDDPLQAYFLRHPLGDRLVSNCGIEYPARYPDTKRLGQESSRPSLNPIPLCIMNRRTFARLHSARMLTTSTDMSVPGDRFFSRPMQLMTASTPSRAPVRSPGERTYPRTKDSRSADDSRSGWRATAVTKCPCASACFTTLRPVAPVAPTTAIFISRPRWHPSR